MPNPAKQTATLDLLFKGGDSEEITIQKVIVLEVPDRGRNEISFRQSDKGWVMTVSAPLLKGRRLADCFLVCTKGVALDQWVESKTADKVRKEIARLRRQCGNISNLEIARALGISEDSPLLEE